MFDPFLNLRKCRFCGKRDSLLEFTRRHGIYGEAGWYYAFHESCLTKVICNPEEHPSSMVDLAAEIIDCLDYWENKKHQDEERYKKRCNWLREHCNL